MRLRMRYVLAGTLAIGAYAGVQAQEAKPLAFEVASVRLSPPKTPSSQRFTPGRVELVSVTLQGILMTTFNVELARLSAPGWLADVRVDIRAAAPGATPAQIRGMLRTLLVERFGLVTHIEQRPFDVYELGVGTGGIRMREVEAVDDTAKEFPDARGRDSISEQIDGPVRSMTIGIGNHRTVTDRSMYERTSTGPGTLRISATRISMAELALNLGPSVDWLYVIDRTGLTGLYQFTIDLPTTPPPGMLAAIPAIGGNAQSLAPPSGLSARKAIESLGLTLERRRADRDVIVVDKIERTPKED